MSYSYHTYKTFNNLIQNSLLKPQISKDSIFGHGINIWSKLSPSMKTSS